MTVNLKFIYKINYKAIKEKVYHKNKLSHIDKYKEYKVFKRIKRERESANNQQFR